MKKIIAFLSLLLFATIFNSCKKHHETKSFTLTLAPADNQTEVHIWGGDEINESGIEAPEIGAATWTSGGQTVFMRAALKFDLSSIPSDASITSAKLTLFSNPTPLNGDHVNANYGSDNSMEIQQITNAWTPTLVTWANQPVATTQGQILIPSTTSPLLDLTDIDVSTLIKNMVGNNSNYGFLIRLQTEQIYNSRIFCSSKYSDASKYPKLVIEYKH